MERTNFEKLDVYKLSEALADDIWNVVAKWEYFAKEQRRGEHCRRQWSRQLPRQPPLCSDGSRVLI